MDDLGYANTIAAEIDRLVVAGHERAAEYADKPPLLAELTAFPHLLNTAAVLLLAQPLTREDVGRIVPYTPSELIDALIDNNVAEGIVTDRTGSITLTDKGRSLAEATVQVHESVAADMWTSAADALETAAELVGPIVERAQGLEPPRTPSNFLLFVGVVDRPTLPAKVLRLITAVRYWRADAHLRALAEADLLHFEAHALNRLWDQHRGLDRVGQGFPQPGRKGVAALEERGFAESGTITAQGIHVREEIETETDRLSAILYDELASSSREQLITALATLPD